MLRAYSGISVFVFFSCGLRSVSVGVDFFDRCHGGSLCVLYRALCACGDESRSPDGSTAVTCDTSIDSRLAVNHKTARATSNHMIPLLILVFNTVYGVFFPGEKRTRRDLYPYPISTE